MFYSPCGLFYNAGLFEEKGWDVPTTWDEMWALGDKAAEEDIALFTYPTAGYFDAFLYSDKAAEIFASAGAVQPIAGMTDKLDGDNKVYYSIYDTGAVAVLDAFAATESIEGVTIRGTFCDPINSLVTGDKTIDDWKEQIIKDNDAFREALKQ